LLISLIPASSSISLPKVEMPELTNKPPVVILTPVLAVTSPIASILVTSSYVSVPPTETLPITESEDVVKSVPSKVRFTDPVGLLEASL
jgi:hypothetical protein